MLVHIVYPLQYIAIEGLFVRADFHCDHNYFVFRFLFYFLNYMPPFTLFFGCHLEF